WVAWTPIVSARGIIGMLFNDVGLSGAPVDETKQENAAILCSLLGTVLDPLRGIPGGGKRGVGEARARRMVGSAAAMLADAPAVEAQELARRLGITVGWFTRIFKAEMGMSLLEYR